MGGLPRSASSQGSKRELESHQLGCMGMSQGAGKLLGARIHKGQRGGGMRAGWDTGHE